jgi:hypothetical protein
MQIDALHDSIVAIELSAILMVHGGTVSNL